MTKLNYNKIRVQKQLEKKRCLKYSNWKPKKATSKQIRLLKELKVKYNETGITCIQASTLIKDALAGKK